MAIFVPRAIPGDVVSARIIEKRKNYAIAELSDLVRPSADRVEASCPAFSQCGGCSLLNMRYEAQLRWKRTLVVDALERIGHIPNPPVKSTLPCESPFHYRNKIVLPMTKERGRIRIGAYARGTHEIAGSATCLLHARELNKLVAGAAEVLEELKYTAYDETTNRGLVRYVLGRVGMSTGELMGGLVTAVRKLPKTQAFVRALVEKVPQLTTVVQNVNATPGNIVLGEETRTLFGKGFIEDVISYPELGSLKFRISATSFYQINPIQAAKCYAQAVRFVTPCECVVDLYSGIGTITSFLASKASVAVGIEESSRAVRDAIQNARLNGINNARFIAGRAEREMPRLMASGLKPQAVVLDPPRAGAAPDVLEAILRAAPEKISYISCYPPTLARDLTILLQRYELVDVQPVDMFPHTIHVECVASLKRKHSS
ncbi:MAG TPA: 23S rRNA (uracil(1939)-C(5))-methyltransferase RlmD [Firmicutes bacterium]|nr:23S rRNA (uracil(1939)-C(5))-methyltransferase RlmD [Bacillota bacterium]